MRLWHKDMIEVLPRKQLLGQYRECCLIAKEISENGKINHILVNYVNNFRKYDLIAYTLLVAEEMKRRGYKCNLEKFTKYFNEYALEFIPKREEIFRDKHNYRYLKQCYYNLQEKFDCGGIPCDEWENIVCEFGPIVEQ